MCLVIVSRPVHHGRFRRGDGKGKEEEKKKKKKKIIPRGRETVLQGGVL